MPDLPTDTIERADAYEAEALRFHVFRRGLYEQTPWVVVTPLVVLANLIVFGLMVRDGLDAVWPTGADAEVFLKWGANIGKLTASGEWWRIGSSAFLHAGAIHLGMNMLGLWNVGRIVERMVGNVGFAALYTVSGATGGLASVYWNSQFRQIDVIAVGASGAICGVVGGLIAFVWRQRHALPRQFIAQVRRMSVLCLAYLIACGFVPMIDNAAHFGGLAAGAICGLILAQPLGRSAWLGWLWRVPAVLILGTAGMAYAIHHHPVPLDPVINRALDLYSEAEDARVSAVSRLNLDAISREECRELIEERVLPPLQEALDRLRLDPGAVSAEELQTLTSARHALELRIRECELRVEAMRHAEGEKDRTAVLAGREADQALFKLQREVRQLNRRRQMKRRQD